MAVTTTKTNKPLNPRGNDQSPKGYNRAELYSGKALDFDGVNDVVTIHEATDLWTGDFSVSWYGDLDATGNFFAFSSGTYTGSAQAGINIWYGGASTLNFSVHFPETDGTGQQGYNLTLAESYKYWHRIDLVFVSSSRLLSLYQNGILVDTATIASNVDAAYMPNGWEFGRSYGGSFPLNGKLTNLKAFNTALTAAQVADLYNNPEKVVPTGVDNTALKLWLPMQEGAGTTAYDGSGNGNHGTISGATYTHGIGAPVAQTAVIDWNKGSNNIPNHDWDSGVSTNNASVSTSSYSAPDGVETAYIFDDGTANTYHRVYKTAGCSAGEITASAFVKKKDVDYIIVGLGVNGGSKKYALVDLVNGTINDTDASPTATSIQSVGDGWYYVSVQATHTSGSGIVYIYGQDPTNGSSIDVSYTGANNQTYIWGASVKDGTINNVFVPTIGTAQTSEVLLPQGLTSGRDITGVNLFENVRKQGALNLDGNSWAEVHDNASVDLTAFSVESWAYPIQAATSAGEEIVGKYYGSSQPYNSYGIEWLTDRFRINYGDTSNVFNVVNAGSSQALNNWHHIVGTYDGANFKIYINGAESNSVAKTSSVIQGDGSIYIGTWGGGVGSATQTFDGPIAQPRIYNRALTVEEVERNYNAGKNIYK